ncbi:hypothetical protein HX867_22250 [Pseudomonas gingeri]|uniref:AidA/PixA family protein n=1 Tax=Pseudomonas gingeri TaxID=117681 RepID=UPI00159FE9FB|nr:AidA/PixA family protein [Pseudomonas gingeri]NVZ64830.1 hypothetical protein [Pseudomonas gingeri]NVZ77057.1 hypothetical protein [Pseudomonas gingeri]
MSSSTNTFDILVVIDADAFVENYTSQGKVGTYDAPVKISSADEQNKIYMLTQYASSLKGQATAELDLTVKLQDNIRWRGVTISKGFDKEIILYNPVMLKQNTTGEISGITNTTPYAPLPLFNKEAPGKPIAQQVRYNLWSAIATKRGHVVYTLSFMLVDSDNQVLGYFTWDPYIEVA